MLALVLWMTLGAVARQAFHVETPWLPAWHMYRTFAVGVFEVELSAVGPEGERALDRLALLGFPDGRAPMSVRRVDDPAQLRAQVDRVCAALGPGADVRVRARVARVRGWEPVRDGSVSACR